jgi:hypothetical protein
MNDIDTIKSLVNIRAIVQDDLGKPAFSAVKYDAYPCPFHHERKGTSFVVYNDGWKCFGSCGDTGDIFGYIGKRDGISFNDAKAIVLRMIGQQPVTKPTAIRQPERPASQPPNEEWQSAAHEIMNQAVACLWSDAGKKAMRYLTESRGLNPVTIQHARLGYVPGDFQEWRKIGGLNVPCGITIPWVNRGQLWGIKVRRAKGNPKYQQVAGGNLHGGLYLCDEIQPGLPLVIDEGEFNALALFQSQMECGQDIASPVAIGSTGNAAISLRWYPAIAAAPRVFARMDAGSGDKAAAVLGSLSAAVRPLGMPNGWKDPNEMLLASGNECLFEWLALAVSGEVVR